jgi:hypothetical protein
MSGVVLGSNNITINGKIMETGKYTFTQEPTSSPSVTKTTIDSDYKYMSFPYNPNIENSPVLSADGTNLMAHYKFNGDLLDSSGNGRTLSQVGTVTYNTSSSNEFPYSQYINATDTAQTSYTKTPNINQNVPISFAFWFYVSGNGYYTMMGYGNYPNPSVQFDFNGGNTLNVYTGLNNQWTIVPTASGLSINTWYHCVYTLNNSASVQTILYINGVSRASGTGNANQTLRSSNNLVIGESGDGGRGFLGRIGDVRIYNKVLTQAEVTQLYNITQTTKYTITFPEQTEVQLLLLDSTKYIEAVPFNITNSSLELIVGKSGSFSSFSSVSTGTNGITYGSGRVSNITGTNVTYNTPIVIIRYKYANYGSQWTYSSSNPYVYHLGNVGIGTTNPTSRLHVLGSVQVNGSITSTLLTANTKNFKIEHPLNINKWLYHGCVEGPRFDNIYRGKKIIINGKGEVDIDEECNTTGGMTKGTFVSLNTNCQVYLENKQTYDSVRGKITDGKLTINCENIEEEIEIDWLIMGERYDNTVITNELTNYEGSLICEHDMD